MSSDSPHRVFRKVLEPGELPEGRVKAVTCEHVTVCMTHHEGQFAALDNRCPHQGGPMGEGSIEGGLLRCPWHGWDYDPLTGKAPGYDNGLEVFPVEIRDDGVYVGFIEEPTHAPTRTDVLMQSLSAWGLRWVFGMVGHSNLGLADAVRREVDAERLGYVGVRHEGAASFACSAYGKLTGRPAACLTIAGPGATNLLTGLWDANVDHAPVIALTGQVSTQWLGRENFQEVDLRGAFGGVAASSASLLPGSDPGELAARAMRSAVLNEGVAHLVFPDEVQELPAEGAKPSSPKGRMPDRVVRPSEGSLAAAVDALRGASRPVFIVGHGARSGRGEVIALAEQLGCPVLTTFKAKGLIADAHPLGGGVLGRSGTPIASWFMNEADLLVVWGASFSKHTGITPKKTTLHVDRDPRALGNRFGVDHMLQSDIGVAAALLREALSEGAVACEDHRAQLAERWTLWRAEKARREDETRGRGIHSATVFAAMTREVPDEAIITVDVGNNTYSFGRYFEPTGQAVLMSGYLGSIGFALPAAMGAWAATQEDGPWSGRKVVSVSGDGGLGQYLAELSTLAKYKMDVTHVVLNNFELGKISKEQRSAELDVWETTLVNPSFAAVAEQCGVLGIRVTEASELDAALRRAIAHRGPAMVEDVALV